MRSLQIVVLVASASLAVACSEPPTAVTSRELKLSLTAGGPAYTPGEQQTSEDLSRGTWALYPVGQGQNVAQTFNPREKQKLGYLELPVICASGTLLNVKIRDGLDGDILYEVNVAGLTAPVGAFKLIQVFNPDVSHNGIKLHKNHEYAFELAAFAGPGATVPATCGIAKGPATNSYARGRVYYRDLSGGPAPWRPLPNGLATNDEDLPFITLVR